MRLNLAFILIGLLLVSTVAEGTRSLVIIAHGEPLLSAPLKLISANEVLTKIQRGDPAEFDDYIIEDKLDLSDLEIKGNVHFNNTEFRDGVKFLETNFKGDAYFISSDFNGPVYIEYTDFNGLADFSKADFNSYASFSKSDFYGPALFFYSNFDKETQFYNTIFNKSADFQTVTFGGDASFGNSMFKGSVDFSYSNFSRGARFEEASFSEDANFRNSKFNGLTYFAGTKFFASLNLTEITFSHLDIHWPYVNHLLCNDGPTYLALMKNFRDLEQYDAVDDIYYQYRLWRQDRRSWLDGYKYYDLLALYTCGYGVKVHYTIACGLIVLLFFGLIYALIIRRRDSNKVKSFDIIYKPLFFSATILLSMPKELFPLDNNTYENYTAEIKYLPILERLIGWGLMLLLINTLSRVMIRY